MKLTPALFRLVIFGCFLCFTNCEKSDEPDPIPDPPIPAESDAVFKLLPSDSNCSTIRTTAVFYESKQLESGQGLELKISVKKAGHWQLKTDTVNGIFFSGQGSFADTGTKTLSLGGSGKPLATGYTILTISQDGTRYPVECSVLKTGFPEEMVPTVVYFKGKINGIAYSFNADRNDPNDIVYGYGGYTGKETDSLSFSTHIASPTGGGDISVSNSYIQKFKLSSEADFKSFFKVGSYPYFSLACPFTRATGVYLGFSAPSSGSWVSVKDGGSQKGSYFNIVGVEDGHNLAGNYYVKVKARFECMLYKINSSDSVKLTEGEMVSYYIRPNL